VGVASGGMKEVVSGGGWLFAGWLVMSVEIDRRRRERTWERLEEKMEEAMEVIAVGEDGWMERYEKVVGAVLPLDNMGRRLVVLSLIRMLEREGWKKGLKVSKEMYDGLEELERRYALMEQEEGEKRMCEMKGRRMTLSEWRSEREKGKADEGEKKKKKEWSACLYWVVDSVVRLMRCL
jgi:hypothetical protein